MKGPIGIKQFLVMLEMARDDTGSVTPQRFLETLVQCGFAEWDAISRGMQLEME